MKWEYFVGLIQSTNISTVGVEAIERGLDQMGDKGWELVDINYGSGRTTVCMKRPKTNRCDYDDN